MSVIYATTPPLLNPASLISLHPPPPPTTTTIASYPWQALAGRFILNGEEVDLPVQESDSLALKVEALRMFLEQKLGTAPFLRCVASAAGVAGRHAKCVCCARPCSDRRLCCVCAPCAWLAGGWALPGGEVGYTWFMCVVGGRVG